MRSGRGKPLPAGRTGPRVAARTGTGRTRDRTAQAGGAARPCGGKKKRQRPKKEIEEHLVVQRPAERVDRRDQAVEVWVFRGHEQERFDDVYGVEVQAEEDF